MSFQDTFVFKSGQPASSVQLPATGMQVSQSTRVGPTTETVYEAISVLTDSQRNALARL